MKKLFKTLILCLLVLTMSKSAFACGAEEEAETVEAVKKLSADVGIPSKLAALKEEDLDFLAESAYADACRPGNPKETSVEDIKGLFRKLM